MASRMITYNEAAALLCVSVRSVRRYVAEGRLAVRKISRKTVLVCYPFRAPSGKAFSLPQSPQAK